MKMITISDYAKRTGVSFQAVNQQVKRHASELTGHITKQGKTTFLDEEAVAFLDNHRRYKAPIVEEPKVDIEQELNACKEENTQLLRKLNLAYEAMAQKDSKYIEVLEENTKLKQMLEAKTATQEPTTTAQETTTPGDATTEQATQVTTPEPPQPTTEATTTPRANRFVRAWKEFWK